MKKNGIKIILAVAVVLVAIVGLSSIFVTQKNEYKLVRMFGRVDRVIDEEGLNFKIPFVEQVDTLPKQVLLYDLPMSDVITSEKKTMVADLYVLWKIDDPLKFAQSLSGSIGNAQSRINANVYEALKTVIGSMTQAEVISSRDGELSRKIIENIGTSMDEYGIALVGVETKHLDLPSDNKAAVYERMISERSQIAAQYTANGESQSQIIKNATDKEVSIMISDAKAKAATITAEGEAEYMKILSAAYNDADRADFYNFIISLDAAKASLINGNKTLILDEDSPIAQIFLGE
ncbi:MAG: protease modulator HflC [Lachnospiraceae bacterium]|nr:protease modulator HflC [Lachnospiraceae bacterium]